MTSGQEHIVDKDYKAVLARYGFKDPLGHSLEMCGDYLELLAELERLRAAEEGNSLKITIEIPVEIDDPLTSGERKQLIQHVKAGLNNDPEMGSLRERLNHEPRMFGTVCRFKFGEMEVKVE